MSRCESIGKSIATILAKELETFKEIILKVQKSSDSQNEWNISKKLNSGYKTPGFIDFICNFKCGDSSDYIDAYSKTSKVCSKKGDQIGVILMPYFKKGSFSDSIHAITFPQIINIINIVIEHYYYAFKYKNFTHGDLFCKNILLSDALEPIIIDFEKSSFESNVITFYRDLLDFIGDISFLLKDKRFDLIVKEHIMAFDILPNDTIVNGLRRSIYLLTK